jgi:hypothetical protein
MHASEPTESGAADSGRRRARQLACAVIAVATIVMCGLTLDHGIRETASFQTSPKIEGAARGYQLEECTYRVIREDVPKGARVFVSDYWQHDGTRLTDLQTLWSFPVAYIRQAQYILAAGRGRPCTRQMLTVRLVRPR